MKAMGATFEPTDARELERNLAEAKRVLGDSAFAREWDAERWSLDQAIAELVAQR